MLVDINDFPILKQKINGNPLVYLDNAATTQKPLAVIEGICNYYRQENANVHRGIHTLSNLATEAYEGARNKVANFINASNNEEIIFTSGTTASINLIANSYARKLLSPGDEILISPAEHHSNLLPWQQLAKETGTVLKYMELTEDLEVSVDLAAKAITPRTKILSIQHLSNVLGRVNEVNALAEKIHAVGGIIVLDGAQSAAHLPIDVQELDCDFFCFSGHKMCGPTGIGVLYGKADLLNLMEPEHFGGEMNLSVGKWEATWKELPWKFEAGTPHIAGAIGLGHAIDYLSSIGMQKIYDHSKELTQYAIEQFEKIPEIKIFGPKKDRVGVIAFNLANIHPHDVSTLLDSQGIAVRAGHHCAQPLSKYMNANATTRASFYIYNDEKDIDKLTQGLLRTKEYFQNVN